MRLQASYMALPPKVSLKILPISKFYACSVTLLKNEVITGGKSDIHATDHMAVG